jgi:hypothetical protein
MTLIHLSNRFKNADKSDNPIISIGIHQYTRNDHAIDSPLLSSTVVGVNAKRGVSSGIAAFVLDESGTEIQIVSSRHSAWFSI